ncbi:MAG: hypothetical protein VYA30_11530 [Myxococcota bacterium]|nr:hypothetical protein [Myxococcota bacterium]
MSKRQIGLRSADSFAGYTLQLLTSFSGLEFKLDDQGELDYGHESGAALLIPYVASYTIDTIPKVPTDDDYRRLESANTAFPFDVFSAVRYWLCDEGHTVCSENDLDQHHRLVYRASVQHQHGHGSIPIVNAYFTLFLEWLRCQLGVEYEKPRAAVILTHDVDQPISPGDLNHHLWRIVSSTMRGNFRASLSLIRATSNELRKRLRNGSEQYWNFEKITELEGKYGFTSTYFFASRPRWFKGASLYDVDYDIETTAFKRIFKYLQDRGAGIGLHASYNACEDQILFANEQKRLSRLTGITSIGCRHHYWHMKTPFWPTLDMHARIGLRYDMSVAFNESPGYRLGIGFPFYPWDPTTGQTIPVIQIPTVIMDGALLYDPSQTVDGALSILDRVLEDVKSHHATVAIDWHVRSSYPSNQRYKKWAIVYEELLKRLEMDPDIEVTTPEKLTQRWRGQSCHGIKHAHT